MPFDQALEAFRRGDNAEAERIARADLEQCGPDEVAARVDAMCMLARVALRSGDLQAVQSWAVRARAAAQSADDRKLERMPLHLEAVAARMSGEIDRSRDLYRSSIALNDELGEVRMAALEHRNLAYLELRADEPGRARALIAESRRRLADVDAPALAPYLMFDEATVAALDGDLESAAAKLAAAEDMFRAAGVVPDPDDAAEIARLHAQLQRATGQGDDAVPAGRGS